MPARGPGLGLHLHSAQVRTGGDYALVLVLAAPSVAVGLVGLALALKDADEPTAEGVDLHLDGRVRLEDVEANFGRVADSVPVGADERLHREVGD